MEKEASPVSKDLLSKEALQAMLSKEALQAMDACYQSYLLMFYAQESAKLLQINSFTLNLPNL